VKRWERVPDLVIRDLVVIGLAGGLAGGLWRGETFGWAVFSTDSDPLACS
jgi:hypothetical protein